MDDPPAYRPQPRLLQHPAVVAALSNYQGVLAAADADFHRQLQLLRGHAARSRALIDFAGSAPGGGGSPVAPPRATLLR
jgi:hypothetical protein